MGVETNTYQIPDLVLSDTFYEWFTVTNNEIIEKLNLLTIYDLGQVSISGQGNVVGDGISAGIDSSGSLFIEIGSTIDKDITFNGNITVNGSTTTINSTNFSVDDYNIVLGATTDDVSDEDIMNYSGNSAGGGMIILGSSGDKEFLWKYTNAAWNTNQNIALENESSIVGSSGIRIATGASGGTATKGLLFGFTAGTTGGVTGSDVRIQTFNSDLAAGYSADAIYINDDGYVSIVNGANKITVDQSGHGFIFGNVVYVLSDGTYAKAIADSVTASEVVGVVSRVYNADRFELTTQGEIVGDFTSVTEESSTLVAGAAYFLSPSTSGKVTGEKPVDNGQIQKTVLIGLGSDRALVKNYIGGEVSIINQTAQALTSNKIIVLQSGHGFTNGDPAYITDSGTFGRANAVVSEGGNFHDVVGIVEEVNLSGNEDAFSLVMSGKFQLPTGAGLQQGDIYYLDNTLPSDGPNITNTRFQTAGSIDKPLFVAESENSGIITIQRSFVIEDAVEEDFVTDVPIGGIIAYHGNESNIPDGYLLCDGRSVPKADYLDLYETLEATRPGENTDPSNTDRFIVPNLSGKFIVGIGVDGNPYGLANQGGLNEVTLTKEQLPSHSHGGHNHTITLKEVQRGAPVGTSKYYSSESGSNKTITSSTTTPDAVGSDEAHENRPPFYALAWIIRARGVNPLADGTQILGGDTRYVNIDSGWDYRSVNVGPGVNDLGILNREGAGLIFNTADNSSNINSNGVPSADAPAELGNPSNPNIRFKSYEHTVDLADIIPKGVDLERVRSIRLVIAFDVDQVRQWVATKYPGDEGWKLLTGTGFVENNTATVDVPISPGQTSLHLKSIYSSNTSNNSTTPDGASIFTTGVNILVDNSLTRERRSYTHRKNLLINGNFDLWQRGVGVGSVYTSVDNEDIYTADRWIRTMNLSPGTFTGNGIEQKEFGSFQSQIPHYPKYYIDVTRPTTVSLPTNGHYAIEQRIEDVRTLANKNMTISFWAKGDQSGKVYLSLERFFGGSSGQKDYFSVGYIDLTTSWRKYTFSKVIPIIPSSRSEGFDNDGFANSYLSVAFNLACKNGHRALSGGDFISNTKTLSLAQVQVEQGASPTEFEIRSPGEELELAQRYFEKSYFPHVSPGTNTSRGNGDDSPYRSPTASLFSSGPGTQSSSTNRAVCDFELSTLKRARPQIRVWTVGGTANQVNQENDFFGGANATQIFYDNDGDEEFSIDDADPKVSFTGISQRKFRSVFYSTNSGNGIAKGVDFLFEWTADAEL